MSHHLVEVRDLCYTYPDGTRALRGVSFLITHGESVAVVGANGTGKSTLLHHLNGCLLPGSGTVRVGDYPLVKQTIPHIRRTVGTVFQDPDDQLFMPTVYDDIAFGPLNLGIPAEEVKHMAEQAMEKTNTAHLQKRQPHRLSGGEKRQVAIATVLSMAPDILIMDEPSSNLDPRSRRVLIELLKSFSHTKIIATHDLDLVLDVCHRTIVLHEGSVIADGPTLQVFQDEDLLKKSNLEKPLRMKACPVCNSSDSR